MVAVSNCHVSMKNWTGQIQNSDGSTESCDPQSSVVPEQLAGKVESSTCLPAAVAEWLGNHKILKCPDQNYYCLQHFAHCHHTVHEQLLCHRSPVDVAW